MSEKKTNKERNDKILELYKDGFSMNEIISKVRVSRTTIWRALSELRSEDDMALHTKNKPKPPKIYPVKVSLSSKNMIYEERCNGATYKELQSKYSLSRTTLWRLLKEFEA